jgi:hypothetical protein
MNNARASALTARCLDLKKNAAAKLPSCLEESQECVAAQQSFVRAGSSFLIHVELRRIDTFPSQSSVWMEYPASQR